MIRQEQITDSELINRFRNGDMDAMEILVCLYKEKLFTFIFSIVRDKHQAEDIFQEVFIKIISNIRTDAYKEKGRFLPWASHIAYNSCMDHFRKTRRLKYNHNSYQYLFFGNSVVSDMHADKKIMSNEQKICMAVIIGLLPQDQREVLLMRHFGEMSFKEIASISNCSVNTVLGRMRYALINIRKLMKRNNVNSLS
jgi:RNA polymerase sigma-70 factor (ECF subfamily)